MQTLTHVNLFESAAFLYAVGRGKRICCDRGSDALLFLFLLLETKHKLQIHRHQSARPTHSLLTFIRATRLNLWIQPSRADKDFYLRTTFISVFSAQTIIFFLVFYFHVSRRIQKRCDAQSRLLWIRNLRPLEMRAAKYHLYGRACARARLFL